MRNKINKNWISDLNHIITQNNENKRYLPHKFESRKYTVEMYRVCGDIEYVFRKYHIKSLIMEVE